MGLALPQFNICACVISFRLCAEASTAILYNYISQLTIVFKVFLALYGVRVTEKPAGRFGDVAMKSRYRRLTVRTGPKSSSFRYRVYGAEHSAGSQEVRDERQFCLRDSPGMGRRSHLRTGAVFAGRWQMGRFPPGRLEVRGGAAAVGARDRRVGPGWVPT